MFKFYIQSYGFTGDDEFSVEGEANEKALRAIISASNFGAKWWEAHRCEVLTKAEIFDSYEGRGGTCFITVRLL